MKRIFVAILAVLILAGPVLAAGSWSPLSNAWTARNYSDGNDTHALITLESTFTAAADDNTVPDKTIDTASYGLRGYKLTGIEVNPGTTGPTDDTWDVDVTDAEGLNLMGDNGDDLDDTDTEFRRPIYGGAISYPTITGNLTVSVGSNAVASATAKIILHFER